MLEGQFQPEVRYDFTIHTYGCKVNTYDTGLLQKRLEKYGHRSVDAETRAASAADSAQLLEQGVTSALEYFGLGSRTPRIHILNTCAVTAEATKEAAKTARRIKAKDPFSTIVITGCGAQVDGDVFDQLTGIDLVVANSHKGNLERLLDQHFKGELKEKVFRSNIFRKEDLEAGGGTEAGHTRSFLKIQDGCNSFCTYCVIPFARGKSRSIPVTQLVRRVNELIKEGAQEVVLTGVHIGDYEDEVGGKKLFLHDLVSAVLEKTTIPRIRLTSLEPVELTSELMALFRDERMCRHFHMSIQSANTRILQGMRRKYDALQVEESLLRIQSEVPGAFVGMDVIAGFPGETEEEFADTYERLDRMPWTRIHVFPYSERPGTKAVNLEGSVPRDERLQRSARLRQLSTDRFHEAARAQLGSLKDVLLLKSPGRGAEGLSRDFWPVRLQGRDGLEMDSTEFHELAARAGSEIQVQITGYDSSNSSRMEGVLTGIWKRDC